MILPPLVFPDLVQTTLRPSPVRYQAPQGRIFSHVRPFYELAVSDLDP